MKKLMLWKKEVPVEGPFKNDSFVGGDFYNQCRCSMSLKQRHSLLTPGGLEKGDNYLFLKMASQ